MNAVVHHLLAVDSVLLFEIRVETSLDVLDNRLPAVVIVNKVAEPGRINNSEAQPHTVFLDVYAHKHVS